MNFSVIGAGGVGGYFGGKLARAGNDVWFVARGKHLAALQQKGLQVHSVEGDWIVPPGKFTDDPSAVGPVDVILFCVKSYDTESAAGNLVPQVHENTIIISLQNGVDNEEKIRRAIPRGHVFGGVSYIYATITAPGIVTHTVGPTKIVFGPLEKRDARLAQRAREILDTMTRAGITAELSEDIGKELWRKFIFIAAVGGMTALTRLTLGDILAVPATREMLADAMRETLAIARARRIDLSEGFVDEIFEILKKYDNSSRSSLYHDLLHQRRMEIEAFSGTIITYGKQLGIPTPVHRAMYAALLPYHLKHEVAHKHTLPQT